MVVNKRDDTFLQSFCSPLTAVSKVHILLFSCFDNVVYTFLYFSILFYTFLYYSMLLYTILYFYILFFTFIHYILIFYLYYSTLFYILSYTGMPAKNSPSLLFGNKNTWTFWFWWKWKYHMIFFKKSFGTYWTTTGSGGGGGKWHFKSWRLFGLDWLFLSCLWHSGRVTHATVIGYVGYCVSSDVFLRNRRSIFLDVLALKFF